jgi:hypothetical protein
VKKIKEDKNLNMDHEKFKELKIASEKQSMDIQKHQKFMEQFLEHADKCFAMHIFLFKDI